MKRITILLIAIILISSNLFALTHVTTKEVKLQGGYGNVVESSVRTITSQGLTQYAGMPFDVFDPYVQYTLIADNPSNGQKIIARWDLIANCNFKLEINATPLMHTDNPNHTPLYYKLAHGFELSYTTNSGAIASVEGYYVFEPNESKTDGSGNTRVYSNGNYLSCQPIFSEIVSNFNTNSGSYIGAVNNDIYFGFTYNTSQFLSTTEAKTTLPDGNYRSTVTITMTAL